jgi:hypothetical protein
VDPTRDAGIPTGKIGAIEWDALESEWQMSSETGHSSLLFDGVIGKTIAPEQLPAGNYLIDDTQYDYEANWAFCRFDDDQVFAARVGFGRGKFDTRDYGIANEPSQSFLFAHVELMTRDGALLWTSSDRFTAQQVVLTAGKLDRRLVVNQNEIFRVQGWPAMSWRFRSDDSEIEVDLQFEPDNVTILPDLAMPRSLFAMWLATGRVQGEVRFRERRRHVSGMMFFDHPRINLQSNDAAPFGWYIYTPMRFNDGSCLAGYFTRDAAGHIREDYSFGVYIEAGGHSHWLQQTNLDDFQFDGKKRPWSWRQHWRGTDITLVTTSQVKPAPILKAWGGLSMAQTDEENRNIPLVFDTEARIVRGDQTRRLEGGGVAEYLAHPEFSPSDSAGATCRQPSEDQ